MTTPEILPTTFPDHTELPESDGTFVKNFQEHPQSILLTDSILTDITKIHPEGNYCIGQDCWYLLANDRTPRKRCRSTRLVLCA